MSRIDELITKHCPDGVIRKTLSDVAKLERGTSITKKQVTDGNIPVVAGGRTAAYLHGEFNRDGESIVVAGSGAYAGFVSWWEGPIFVSDAFSVQTEEKQLLPKYCFHWLRSKQSEIHNLKSGGGVPHVYAKDVGRLRIPVPPIEVQREIVRILDAFSKLEAELEAELEARKQQYEHYRAELLVVPEAASWTTLGELCKIETGKLNANAAVNDGEYAFFTTAQEISRIDRYRWDTEALLVAGNANVGDVKHYIGKFDAYQRTYVLTQFSELVDVRFLYYVLKNGLQRYLEGRTNSAAMTYIVLGTLRDLPVPIMPSAEQRRIVEVLDKFDALVNDLSVGLPAELAARRQQYEYYRDRLLTFEELPA